MSESHPLNERLCESCDAVAELVPVPGFARLRMLNVFHDDHCRFLANYEGRP